MDVDEEESGPPIAQEPVRAVAEDGPVAEDGGVHEAVEHAEDEGGTPLSAIATPSADADDADDADAAARCVICLDAVAEPCAARPCGHRHFDFLCLVSWLLQRQPSCPLCKATVAAVQYGDDLAKTFPVPAKEDRKQEEASRHSRNEEMTSETHTTTTTTTTTTSRQSRRIRHDAAAAATAVATLSAEAALERRRRVYRLGLYARHVGANRVSRCYRELTPQLFARDPDLVSRARAFLRRELQVFWPEAGGRVSSPGERGGRLSGRVSAATGAAANTEFLLEYIVAILRTVDLQGSGGQAEDLLRGFFGGRRATTRHFLHELRSFLRSPHLTLVSWDRHVQYGPPGRQFLRSADEEEEDEEEVYEQDEDRQQQHGHPSAEKSQWVRPRGDFWRPPPPPSQPSHGRRSNHALAATPTRGSPQPLPLYRQRQQQRQRRHEATLRQACRRYDPS